MLNCYLVNLSNGDESKLLSSSIEVRDDNEYLIRVEVSGRELDINPIVCIGDVELKLVNIESIGATNLYNTIKGGFFDNAIFLNYFGECELTVSLGEEKVAYIIEVNVSSYKADIAGEMLQFLLDNTDDILQTCYSKSRTGYCHKNGDTRNIIKLSSLTQTIDLIETLLPAFRSDFKYNTSDSLQFNSNKPTIVDENCASWLSENMDKLEISNSKDYKLRIYKKHYQVDLPNSITSHNTNLKENRVLHQFILVSLSYLKETKTEISNQIISYSNDFIYQEYIKFDTVIKDIINPILIIRIKMIDDLIFRINRLRLFFITVIPVKVTTGEMPVQTSYTLRHKHYARAFNKISEFYKASDANKSNSDFLLGLRNLTQIFELCCLYSLVKYFNTIATPVSASWVNNSMAWDSESTNKINVLANNFFFENEHYLYTLNYEKKFYSFSKETMALQEDNLVRVDAANNYYEPDFTIKVSNKKTGDYYYIVLDAKFSRSYKMRNNSPDRAPSVLQSIFTKYSTNLKAFKANELVNATRYVGVLFGLSKSENEQKRIYMFNKIHDIDGYAPIFPFSAADFISFSDENRMFSIIDKYISK
ncbi:hypothetical protein [Photobacterium carnosum]|uniref:hypothetical protein n=1 Tax=Photobacterium carnosum TaxID=2023717 RepID=UPI00128BE0A1|nr:hypothetical protein [Photobacterium carnosum]KAE8177068.1 hypothetical protein CIT27_08905 [Photobacterium carnosum]MCD9497037.1 hypothetical protein [Photobacterium carnosum]MCD9513972.1 hypothetical protein [Photobacterium carnosum]MCD9555720.1 hypothetical protein [Photobacterium carnosum]